MIRSASRVFTPALIATLMSMSVARAVSIEAADGLAVKIDEATGSYEVTARNVGWTFAGSLKTPLTLLAATDAKTTDGIGAFKELAFTYEGADKTPQRGSIRVYPGKSVALFTQAYPVAANKTGTMFPAFTALPANLHPFSHHHASFSVPEFSLAERNMPWVMFDDAANTWIMSPASHFLAARMSGDGKTLAGSGLNPKIAAIPEGFEQGTLLAVGKGINATWDTWGRALTDVHGKKRPTNDCEPGLKYLGYWTDNGGYYYYNYDQDLGYAGTLLALADHYKQQKIPLGYLQLDSWWYYKTFTNVQGKPGAAKAPNLPEGEWNRYGGLLDYTAHKDLFPDGLAAFQKKLGLPLITHNRWIDRTSPYHQNYKISGVAAVDPKWWDDIATYLKASGVITYEQDWLNEIYNHSPELGNTVDQGDAFMDNMARATRERGMTMQYCMPLPCQYLQGSKYDNLTTIRVSFDNFGRPRWMGFMFDSRLASALGIWPFSDVLKSTDRSCLLLANLSAGMVGIGDAIGKENRDNIMQTIRSDGVLVKPDVPLTPTDETYLAYARDQKDLLIGSTFTDHAAGRTAYVFACSQNQDIAATATFTPAKLGVNGDCYVYDVFGGATATRVADGAAFSGKLGTGNVSYYIAAPLGKSGMAFLGDKGKYVALGKQRIASVKDEPARLTTEVVFAEGEGPATLHGFATGGAPKCTAQNGTVGDTTFDNATKHFTVIIKPVAQAKGETRVTVVMDTR